MSYVIWLANLWCDGTPHSPIIWPKGWFVSQFANFVWPTLSKHWNNLYFIDQSYIDTWTKTFLGCFLKILAKMFVVIFYVRFLQLNLCNILDKSHITAHYNVVHKCCCSSCFRDLLYGRVGSGNVLGKNMVSSRSQSLFRTIVIFTALFVIFLRLLMVVLSQDRLSFQHYQTLWSRLIKVHSASAQAINIRCQ